MKKQTTLLLFILMMTPLFFQNVQAQTNKEELDFIQSIFGMEKKQAVAEFLNISPGDPFWEIYDQYETERKALGKERIEAINQYAEKYTTMQDADYDQVVSTMISLKKRNDKLIEGYYKKVKKASGSKVATQFFQIEEYILSEIRASLMEAIPFIGEFEKQ
ncbi:hypothetical protein [Pararhodonellum marinum]|uniref:hypothetical protein n=1 Tax=Pararhodonellum marinum TaxID=2755358 RepID=UPI00188F8706|nr:hypothetical protein [Pararhodonellum marinum]